MQSEQSFRFSDYLCLATYKVSQLPLANVVRYWNGEEEIVIYKASLKKHQIVYRVIELEKTLKIIRM